MGFIEAIEHGVGRQAEKDFLPIQAGNVPATYADASELGGGAGFQPATLVSEGIARFVFWYREYFDHISHV